VQLRDYFRIIIKRGWIIVLAVVLTVACTLVFSRLQTQEYRSTIYLNVWPARLDWGLQQTIKGLMRNYAGQIRSRETALEVINRLQLDITPDQLREKLTVSPIEEDFLLQIDADDYDPLIARDVAQTTAEVFVEDIKVYMLEQDKQDRVEVSIRDYALPGDLHKPKWKINALAGAVFGGIIGLIVIFVIEWLASDIIRSSRDLEEGLGIAVLGAIPTVATATSARSHGRGPASAARSQPV
jgi:capsular polysaccharide biosynthesis protein